MFAVHSCFSQTYNEKPSKRIDHPHETGWLFSIASKGQNLQPVKRWRSDIYDYTDAKQGDFSIHYTIRNDIYTGVIGFTPGQFLKNWGITPQHQLKMWLKINGESAPHELLILLVDSLGNRGIARIDNLTSQKWQEIDIPLNTLKASKSFNWEQVSAIQLEGEFKPGLQIWFDDVRFSSGNRGPTIGITDKPLEQRIGEAKATREQRVKQAFELAKTEGSENKLNKHFAKLWMGEDLKEVNRSLQEILTTENPQVQRQYSIHDDWSLSLKSMLIRMYFNFSSKSKVYPGRLEKETEEALLILLWEKMVNINDIHLARKSTWWLIGSENHDINSKVAALLTSQIFMNEPKYAQRIYPDKGKGGGSSYWFHQMYANSTNKGPEGNADWADGKEYTAADHYNEWLKFWNEYITERARKGFFLEVASPKYMKHTIPFLMNIYDFSNNETLKKRMGMFLDLIWAEWTQDQLGAVRGGAKTRWGSNGFPPMWEASRFYLGGPADATEEWYAQVQSNYDWPEIVWRLALDQKGKGEYAYSSRKPGEEQPELQPRPDGLERTMTIDTEARFHRYSWVTPDYILGTQMDHPLALESHLSAQNRWQGISFASDFQAFISPVGLDSSDPLKWERTDAFYRSVQSENILITQQNRRWMQQQPSWYPSKDIYEREFGVWFHGNFDKIKERKGWIFVKEGNAYVALKVLMGEYEFNPKTWGGTGRDSLSSLIREDTYEWDPEKDFIKFKDRYSPVIMESGTKSEFPNMDAFEAYILQKHLELRKTVAPGWYILIYGEGTKESPKFYFNAANNEIPKVNEKYIDYAPSTTFMSPFLKSIYKSGVIKISVDGMEETWDFSF
ncbi:hypothetical protein DHD80_14690 [Gramella sp. AN32]|nr:hypothetical protein [Gramella sp. AN32]